MTIKSASKTISWPSISLSSRLNYRITWNLLEFNSQKVIHKYSKDSLKAYTTSTPTLAVKNLLWWLISNSLPTAKLNFWRISRPTISFKSFWTWFLTIAQQRFLLSWSRSLSKSLKIILVVSTRIMFLWSPQLCWNWLPVNQGTSRTLISWTSKRLLLNHQKGVNWWISIKGSLRSTVQPLSWWLDSSSKILSTRKMSLRVLRDR